MRVIRLQQLSEDPELLAVVERNIRQPDYTTEF